MCTTESSKKMKRACAAIEGAVGGTDLDAATQRNLEAIDVCQIEIDNYNVKAAEEILKIEQKYNLLRKPLFDKRSENIRNIPNFWFSAIMNHPDLSSIIDEKDEDCLQFLNRIDVEEYEDVKSGYEISFYFDENPFFENSVLTKEFHLELDSPSSQSTKINWKDNHDLSKNETSSTKSGRKRRFESKSFFSWFLDNVDPVSDDIAEIFKDDLWQNPLQYYLVPDMEEGNGAENEDDSDSSVDENAEEQ